MNTPRDRLQRRLDTLGKLESAADIWVATADSNAAPYLIPLSFYWDGSRIVVCAERSSRTIQNLLGSRSARLGLEPTRDVVMLDVVVGNDWPAREVPPAVADGFAQRAGWDPRRDSGDYVYVALEPRRIQAWREANEIAGRTLMRDGAWLP